MVSIISITGTTLVANTANVEAEETVISGKIFNEIAVVDMSDTFSYIRHTTYSDNYAFFVGFQIIDGAGERKEKISHICVVSLKTAQIVYNARVEELSQNLNVVDIVAAQNDYLFILHKIDPSHERHDSCLYLDAYKFDGKNFKAIDSDLVFPDADTGEIATNGKDVVVVTTEYYDNYIFNSRIYRVDIQDPEKPALLSNLILAYKDHQYEYGQDGKIKKDGNGNLIYTVSYEKWRRFPGHLQKLSVFGDYFYANFYDEILAFDLYRRDEKENIDSPNEKHPLLIGKLGDTHSSSEGFKNVFDFTKVDNEGILNSVEDEYVYFIGKSMHLSNEIEVEPVAKIGEDTYKIPGVEYGITVLSHWAHPYLKGHGETKVVNTDRVLSAKGLPFTPIFVEAIDNWVYVFGYNYVRDGENLKREEKFCILDASNPRDLKVSALQSFDYFIADVHFDSNKIHAFILDGNSKLHVLEIVPLEKKEFIEQFKKATKQEQAKDKESDIEHGCRLYLRALGSVQVCYWDAALQYGSWESLVQDGYIDNEKRYNRSNMIEGYSIAVFIAERGTEISNSKFTIIAQPDEDNDLSVLGITEGQDVLEFSGTIPDFRKWLLKADLFSLQDDKMWKPLR